MTRKYLPPGTLYELYQYYISWCSTHNILEKASCLSGFWQCVFCLLVGSVSSSTYLPNPTGSLDLNSFRYPTFLRRWNTKWTLILKFRDRSMFSQCDVCQELKKQFLAHNPTLIFNAFFETRVHS